jgi:hypothetical protein
MMKMSTMQRRAAEVFLHTVPKGEIGVHFRNERHEREKNAVFIRSRKLN